MSKQRETVLSARPKITKTDKAQDAPTRAPAKRRSVETRKPRPGAPPVSTTRTNILKAAAREFAANGLAGARVDAVAKASGCNKAMIYYFFASKDDLYLEVLEDAYSHMRRHERELDITDLEPADGITKLVQFKFDYVSSHRGLISLLNAENVQKAKHLKRSKRLRDMHSPLVATLSQVLARGAAQGTFRPNIDPVQLYISIASLSYFYLSNGATLAAAFGRDLLTQSAMATRRAHAVEVILRYLTVAPDDENRTTLTPGKRR
jgi:TetR/AcrR family transcriptional regulator